MNQRFETLSLKSKRMVEMEVAAGENVTKAVPDSSEESHTVGKPLETSVQSSPQNDILNPEKIPEQELSLTPIDDARGNAIDTTTKSPPGDANNSPGNPQSAKQSLGDKSESRSTGGCTSQTSPRSNTVLSGNSPKPTHLVLDGTAQERDLTKSKCSSKSATSMKLRYKVEHDEHQPHSKDKIRTDVFLTDYTVPRMNSNLLANSLQARLRKTIPFDLRDNKDAVHRIKRDSMKDMVQLAVLDKQFNAEMQRQKSFLKSQENQIRRRQQVLRRRTELNKISNERIQAQIRARTEPIIVLPKLNQTGAQSAPVDREEDDVDNVVHEITAFSPVQNEKQEEISNLEYSIRMVRMCQSPGAFLNEVTEILSRKKSKRKPEEIEMMTDDASSITSNVMHRKATRTLSNTSRKTSAFGTYSNAERHTLSAPPNLPNVAPPNRRSRVVKFQGFSEMGIDWHLPTTEQSTKQKKRALGQNRSDFKKVSKDLHPVATLMNTFGLSEKRIAAHVPEVGENTPSVVLPPDVSKYLTPVEMANHVAKFMKKYPVGKKPISSDNNNNNNKNELKKVHEDKQNSCDKESIACKTDQNYSVGSGMSTNRSVTSQNVE